MLKESKIFKLYLIMNYIDAILYINLAHRCDRNEHILTEINKLCKDNSKIHRICAIKKDEGALGCALSHIKALNFALEHTDWKNVLILEDDFTFKSNNTHEINNDIDILFKTNPDFNVGILSSNLSYLRYHNTSHFRIKKVLFSQTTSAYILKRDYISKLLSIFEEAVENINKYGVKHEYHIDQYWSKLQAIDNWFILYPPIGYQYDNYSDIENRFVAYNC